MEPKRFEGEVWSCANCGKAFADKELAAKHCECRGGCGTVDPCKGAKTANYSFECRECSNRRQRELYERRLEKAVDVTDTYAGWVFDDRNGSGDETNYVQTVEDMIEQYQDDEIEIPEFVFACRQYAPKPVSAECVVERIIDDVWGFEADLDGENPHDVVVGKKEVTEAVRAFLNANLANCLSYMVDYSQKIRVTVPNE